MSRESTQSIDRTKRLGAMSLDEQRAALAAEKTGSQEHASPSERDLEIHALRCSLYQAALHYAEFVMEKDHDLSKAIKLSDELEAAAEAWATR